MLDLRCRFGFHGWDYFTMTRLDGGTEAHRCCLRCEKSELLWWEAAEEKTVAEIGSKIAHTNESSAAFAAVREDILRARKLLGAFATDADIALLNSDIANSKTQQEIGRANLLALFGVKAE